MSYLIGRMISLKACAVNVIVGRIAVDEAVEEEGVEREAP